MSELSTGQVYRRLLSYVWPQKWALLVSVFGFALYASSAPALAHLMGLVEKTLRLPHPENVELLVMLLVGVFFYRGIGTFLGKYFVVVVARGVVHNLRSHLFAQMVRLPSHFYDGESSGRLISRVIFDVEQVTGASTRAITTLVQEGLTVVGLMAYLVWLDASLTLIFLALVPIIGVVVSLASRFFRRYSRRIQNSMGEVTQVTNESVSGYREVRTFGGEQYERERFEAASRYNQKQTLKFALTNAINVPLNQQIVALGLGVMVYLMFQRVASGTMSGAEFLQFMTAASLIAKPIRALTDINSIVQKGIAAAQSIFAVLDAEPEPAGGDHAPAKVAGELQFKQVSFRYPGSEQDALSQIDLHVKAGETIALVGPSGSGKSTLVNLIPRFYQHNGGEILLDGHAVDDYQLANLRSHIAIVSQSVTLFNTTVRDNIAYGELAGCSQQQIEAAARAASAHEFIEQLQHGYDTQVGEGGSMLSGGQRQRIAMARALLKDAPLLILDEATSALDTESERHIQQALEQLMQNRTTLVIAHRLSTIENADRIVVVENGRIVEQGSHRQLLQLDGAYARLHRLQFSEGEA
ncbi:lipid A export ATP-binding/permease protein MsbA [Bacterioplanes sanyensis]|uniref:lipid A export permease/ATP-binding protein MsbA n=1 Tax=Bacterioplanes sanyensis TaxID=1249553 RepID=UPI00167374E3|nr:lipid A export permease/ATP-binding protein MsbA [Bacterioplanes sanyensis]GGY54142.1 lipid A export ATP-binding/permease protein MsbA [Bacterioplanes sanyensis]